MAQNESTAHEWFEQATRCYTEHHQGCPWCRGAYRVYRTERGQIIEYRCGTCDFLACHERETGRYFMGPGEKKRASVTMHAI